MKPSQDPRILYLELMKRILTRSNIEEPSIPLSLDIHNDRPFFKKFLINTTAEILRRWNLELVKNKRVKPERRQMGTDLPMAAETMIGMSGLNHLEQCILQVLDQNIPGDFIETGVWRGGACIFMRAVLKAFDISDRSVWVADSFDGVPAPNVKKYPSDENARYHELELLRVPLSEVKKNFEKYQLLDENVRFLEGFFKDTLPIAPIQKLAILRLDGDLYESTMDALVNLYPRLSRGGFVIVDDYDHSCCRAAVDSYRQIQKISDDIISVDQSRAYWKKTGL